MAEKQHSTDSIVIATPVMPWQPISASGTANATNWNAFAEEAAEYPSAGTGAFLVERASYSREAARFWAYGAANETFGVRVYERRWSAARGVWSRRLLLDLTCTLGTATVIDENGDVLTNASAVTAKFVDAITVDIDNTYSSPGAFARPSTGANADAVVVFDPMGAGVLEYEFTSEGTDGGTLSGGVMNGERMEF